MLTTHTDELISAAQELLEACKRHELKIAAAESCTGGLIMGALTEVAGSSAVVERGFVTYSNEAKAEMLGVPMELINQHGAVSEAVARAMVQGALDHSRANIAVSVTGVAGPGGGTLNKPVGLVHFGFAKRGESVRHVERRFENHGRTSIRTNAIQQALDGLYNLI